ncbi:3-oxoacyl-ACP synthase III family protein [Streptomyces sp. NPDC127068]|uniref:3-oxoacyl-ACP synthase III family protein n=1 Tax=Streptomyces sp. NPDC127068 TaxID=3347127 RepID=UPI003660A42D
MRVTSSAGCGIIGLGVYLPERVVANEEIADQYGVTAQWIEDRTGIVLRHYADPDESTHHLAARAAERALRDAEVDAADIEFLAVSTSTSGEMSSGTACRVQHQVGARRAWAVDVGGACAGFLFALRMARDVLTGSGGQGLALVVGADSFSPYLKPGVRSTGVLFGDGAGAAVLGPAPAGRGLLHTTQGSDGSLADLANISLDAMGRPATPADLVEAGKNFYAHLDGREIREHAHRIFPAVVHDLVRGSGITFDRVDLVVPHQANVQMLQEIIPEMGVARERVVVTADRHGNTGAASIPLALAVARDDGRVASGANVLTVAVGAGINWAGAIQRWI